MSGLADYAGYCSLKCEIDFSSGVRDENQNINTATITIATQGVIWAIYPSDGTPGDPTNAFRISSSGNENDDPTTAVPLASLSVANVMMGSYVTINYDPTLSQGTNKFYFNAYLWGDKNAVKYSTVSLAPQLNGNMTLKINGNSLHNQGLVNVKWVKNPLPSSSSAVGSS